MTAAVIILSILLTLAAWYIYTTSARAKADREKSARELAILTTLIENEKRNADALRKNIETLQQGRPIPPTQPATVDSIIAGMADLNSTCDGRR